MQQHIKKHAKTAMVTIYAAIGVDDIDMIVKDNGVGFETTKLIEDISLENIRNRAESYNGFASLKSSPDNGCTIRVNLFRQPKLLNYVDV